MKDNKLQIDKLTEELKLLSDSNEALMRGSPLGIGILVDRNFVEVNDMFCEMIGYPRKDLIGKSASLLYPNMEEFERVGTEKYANIREKGTGAIKTKFKTSKGDILDIYLSSTPVDHNDWSKGVVFNALDITEIITTQKKVKESQERFKILFNNINDSLFVYPWSETGFEPFVEVNDEACRKYGYSRKDLLKMRPPDLAVIEKIDEEEVREFRSDLDKKKVKEREMIHISKSGKKFPVEITTSTILLNGQKHILSVVRDISERKRAQKELQETNYWLNEAQRVSQVGYYSFDIVNDKWTCSSTLNSIFGINDDYLKTFQTWIDLIHPDQQAELMNYFTNDVVSQHKPFDREYKIIRKSDNDQRWMHGRGELQFDDNGELIRMFGTIRDITQQKKAEKELILSKEKAEESDRLKSAFLTTMSHELRTPLNAVIGFSNLIGDEENLESIHDMNTIIHENGNKLLKLIESLFEISILETQNANPEIEKFHVIDMFSGLGTILKTFISEENKGNLKTILKVERSQSKIEISTDRKKVEQLMANLLSNAVRYTEKGTIEYGYAVNGDSITLFVKDTGIGINEDHKKIIFDKFRQVDETYTRSHGGVGLGLALCKEISNLLKGELKVDSVFGKGSMFSLTLKGVVESDSSQLHQDVDTGIPDLKGEKVLIVEDTEASYLYLQAILQKIGANIIWARNGTESVNFVKEHPDISLILMDIRLTDISGYDATRQIKKLHPGLVVIAQTAYAMKEDRRLALDAGCDEYLSKPIRQDDLYKILQKYSIKK